jgi:hypothetical protein
LAVNWAIKWREKREDRRASSVLATLETPLRDENLILDILILLAAIM